jgi:predicted DNA-binding protein
MNLTVPDELVGPLVKVAKRTRKTPDAILVHLLRSYLEDIRDASDAFQAYRRWEHLGNETTSLDDIARELGLDTDDVDS